MTELCDGCPARTEKPRSIAQHRRFFGVVAAAFDQWPHGHRFQPLDAEHLRAWLLCKAGHGTATAVPIPEDTGDLDAFMHTIESVMRASDLHTFCEVEGRYLVVWRAKSIKFAKLPHKAFVQLNGAIDEIIAAEIGVTADQLLEGRQRAA